MNVLRTILFATLVAIPLECSADVLIPAELNDAGTASGRERIWQPLFFVADATGDSFSLAPLVHTATQQFYLVSGGPTAHTFDGFSESGGNNLGGSAGGTFAVIEQETALGGGQYRIDVEVTALDSGGNPEPWIDAAYAGFGAEAWRLDVGTNAGAIGGIDDRIGWGEDFTVLSSNIEVFNSAGTSYGTFPMALDSSLSPDGVGGIAYIGLGGADIAGFDMATIRLSWVVQAVPEPSTFGILGVAVFGIGVVTLRKRKPARTKRADNQRIFQN